MEKHWKICISLEYFLTLFLVLYPIDTRGSFPGIKRSESKSDHSSPSSAEVKECMELHLHPPYAFMA